MAYLRKRTYPKKKVTRKRVTQRATSSRRKLVSLIKRTVLKKCELKELFKTPPKANVYHNCFYNPLGVSTGFVWPMNASLNMPAQGVRDDQRVGDEIDMTGFKISLLIGQQADRPNVNWRYTVMSVPKGSSITYGNWFTVNTGNILLDDPNRDFVKVHKTGIWRPNEAGLVGGSADEYTFTKRMYIPYKKHLKFGPGDSVNSHNDDDLYFVLMGYDAFGSLITDIVGYVQLGQTLLYRDP